MNLYLLKITTIFNIKEEYTMVAQSQFKCLQEAWLTLQEIWREYNLYQQVRDEHGISINTSIDIAQWSHFDIIPFNPSVHGSPEDYTLIYDQERDELPF